MLFWGPPATSPMSNLGPQRGSDAMPPDGSTYMVQASPWSALSPSQGPYLSSHGEGSGQGAPSIQSRPSLQALDTPEEQPWESRPHTWSRVSSSVLTLKTHTRETMGRQSGRNLGQARCSFLRESPSAPQAEKMEKEDLRGKRLAWRRHRLTGGQIEV